MYELSETILAKYQVRKSRAQKAAFRAFLREALEAEGHAVTEESARFAGTNLIVGDLARAKYVFTAHYDTCAVLPVPNFLAPKNLPVSILYQVFLTAAVFGLVFAASFGVTLLLGGGAVAKMAAMAAALGMALLLFMGPANRHTANDNTSGVVVLTEALCSLPPENRHAAAFVFFDNEELGLLGSAHFNRLHGRRMQRKTLVNFDCVSDGDHILFVMGKKLRADPVRTRAMDEALVVPAGKTKEFAPSGRALYPSDQLHFSGAAGVVALGRMPLVGYYISRIHTPRDTRFDRVNIELLRQFVLRLAAPVLLA